VHSRGKSAGAVGAYYVLVRGPLGVGKSTVSELLANQIGGQVISIDQILEEHHLWESGARSEFLTANEFAAEQGRALLLRGIPVIFDGNFYWEEQIENLVGRLNFRHYVFTLAAPLAVCIERDQRREKPHGRAAAKAVYAKATAFDWGIGIDATGPLDATVEEIVSHLS
jgi:predicted kinase